MKNMAKRFKDEEFLFTLTTAFKVSLIFVFLTLFALYLIWLILSINTLFIEAQTLKGFENIQSIYKDYILSNTIDYIKWI